MPQDEFQALLQFFKVLADENRLKLLGLLANGERSVEELAALLQLRAPTVSHHLARLKELDLVEMRSDGNTHYYRLNVEALRKSNKQLLTPEKMASWVEAVEGDAWDRKVLRDFFDGTRLKEIPASLKKRSVILKWLADQFAYGVLYKEAQVNEILQRHHPDSAFLRRELISAKEGLMQRENGFYWRIPSGDRWRSVTLRSADKQTLQGWLGLPEGDGPFPTILELHEGPELAHAQGEWLSPLSQVWVEQGFAYLVINYPGPASFGLIPQGPIKRYGNPVQFGLTFQERVDGHPGRWEVEDLLVARNWLLEQGIAQPQRILLTGWSYSAFVTLLALGQHPALWAGAIAGSALTDWLLTDEEVPDKTLETTLFYGTAQERHDQYVMSSPITYTDQVTTPILLLQGRHHPRYSARQAQVYQEKMQPLGKAVELQWLADRPGALDVELMVEQRERMLNFARRILKDEKS